MYILAKCDHTAYFPVLLYFNFSFLEPEAKDQAFLEPEVDHNMTSDMDTYVRAYGRASKLSRRRRSSTCLLAAFVFEFFCLFLLCTSRNHDVNGKKKGREEEEGL